MSFDEAVGLNMDGVGIMLHEELGLTGIDFDHCVQDGAIIDPWVAQKVKELNSYTEYSVSGTGIHVLVWGRLPGKKCDGGKIEMYDRSRFLIMTGNLVPGTPTGIRNAQVTIDAIHLEVFGSGDALEARISGKTAPQQNQRVSPKSNNSFHGEEGGGGKEGKEGHARGGAGSPRFEIRPAAELTRDEWARIDNLRDRLPNFASTWAVKRETSPWPFPSGRYTSSEYEASIAFFLVGDGWDEQEIMDAICAWRRECGLAPRTEYCRYACTIGKAVSRVTPRSKGLGDTRKEPKGAWRHGYTRDLILGSIIETPRTPKQISEVTGIEQVHVRVVLRRLAKDGKVIRNNHTYLCAPTEVPWYLQNIPENAGEPTGEEREAEYEAWLAAGMPGLGAVEEEVEAPLGFAPPAAVPCMSTLPDFDELEPELVKVATEPIPAGKHLHFSLAALKREAAEKRRAKGYASRYMPTATDLELERLMTMDRPPIDDSVNPFLE